ncbi:MAG: hypothetical protein QW728_01615 [Thermoplasmata archaeon]
MNLKADIMYGIKININQFVSPIFRPEDNRRKKTSLRQPDQCCRTVKTRHFVVENSAFLLLILTFTSIVALPLEYIVPIVPYSREGCSISQSCEVVSAFADECSGNIGSKGIKDLLWNNTVIKQDVILEDITLRIAGRCIISLNSTAIISNSAIAVEKDGVLEVEEGCLLEIKDSSVTYLSPNLNRTVFTIYGSAVYNNLTLNGFSRYVPDFSLIIMAGNLTSVAVFNTTVSFFNNTFIKSLPDEGGRNRLPSSMPMEHLCPHLIINACVFSESYNIVHLVEIDSVISNTSFFRCLSPIRFIRGSHLIRNCVFGNTTYSSITARNGRALITDCLIENGREGIVCDDRCGFELRSTKLANLSSALQGSNVSISITSSVLSQIIKPFMLENTYITIYSTLLSSFAEPSLLVNSSLHITYTTTAGSALTIFFLKNTTASIISVSCAGEVVYPALRIADVVISCLKDDTPISEGQGVLIPADTNASGFVGYDFTGKQNNKHIYDGSTFTFTNGSSGSLRVVTGYYFANGTFFDMSHYKLVIYYDKANAVEKKSVFEITLESGDRFIEVSVSGTVQDILFKPSFLLWFLLLTALVGFYLWLMEYLSGQLVKTGHIPMYLYLRRKKGIISTRDVSSKTPSGSKKMNPVEGGEKRRDKR